MKIIFKILYLLLRQHDECFSPVLSRHHIYKRLARIKTMCYRFWSVNLSPKNESTQFLQCILPMILPIQHKKALANALAFIVHEAAEVWVESSGGPKCK